jgi:hypothetical protein
MCPYNSFVEFPNMFVAQAPLRISIRSLVPYVHYACKSRNSSPSRGLLRNLSPIEEGPSYDHRSKLHSLLQYFDQRKIANPIICKISITYDRDCGPWTCTSDTDPIEAGKRMGLEVCINYRCLRRSSDAVDRFRPET